MLRSEGDNVTMANLDDEWFRQVLERFRAQGNSGKMPVVIPEGKEEEFRQLAEKFRAAGATDPELWAASEMGQGIPQLARFCFLRALWPDMIDKWRENVEWIDRSIREAERDSHDFFADAGVALARLLAIGASREELASVARMVAYDTAFGVVDRIDESMDWDHGVDDGYPTWELREIGPDGQPTGRTMDGLHEDLLSMDPSGREGRPE